jgi:hypothetical protein
MHLNNWKGYQGQMLEIDGKWINQTLDQSKRSIEGKVLEIDGIKKLERLLRTNVRNRWKMNKSNPGLMEKVK